MTSKKTSFNNSGNATNIIQGEIVNINKIEQAESIKDVLIQLSNLLSSSLRDKDEQIQSLTQQLVEHANKPAEKRDKLTIATILSTISTYIGMVGSATDQIQKIKPLFEQVRIFFGL